MFTVHEIDRNGNPHRELARTPFADVADTIGLGMAQKYWPEDSHVTQDLLDKEVRRYVICEDGEPYKYVMLEAHTQKRWRCVYASDLNGA